MGRALVVHTPPGHASMVAYDIDCAKRTPFIGTVAGDDTIFVALGEDVERAEAIRAIEEIVAPLRGKIK